MTKRRIQQNYREQMENKNNINFYWILIMAIFLSLTFIFAPTLWKSNNPSVTVKKMDNAEASWWMMIPKIDKKLIEVSVHYTGIAFVYNSKPLKIIIKTSLQGVHSDEEVELPVNTTNEVIITNNLLSLLQEDEGYEIIIKGKDKMDLSRKTFF